MCTNEIGIQRLELHIGAPEKPPVGEACNGCGVCCAAEPCPFSRLLLRRRWFAAGTPCDSGVEVVE